MRFTLNAIVILAIGLSSTSFASDTDLLREANDRAQIQELMWNYVRALDSLNEEAYASVFTEDGQFSSGARVGKAMPRSRRLRPISRNAAPKAESEAKGQPKSLPMYHVITNSKITFADKDHARYYAYWMAVFGAAGQTTPRALLLRVGVSMN